MLRKIAKIGLMATLAVVVGVAVSPAQNAAPDEYAYNPRIDRYLDAEVWTDRSDGEYYVGDRVTINFRISRDAFVAIYTIDTRGRAWWSASAARDCWSAATAPFVVDGGNPPTAA